MMSTITNVYAREHTAGERSAGGWSPMSDADAGWLLVHCFERAVANPCGATMDALCSATVALALTHRATAFGPERAVRMLKDLLRGHGGAGWSPSIVADRGILSAQPESLIYTKLFGWWVSAYYADRPSTIPQSSAATARGA
jgi:hypothetical protein